MLTVDVEATLAKAYMNNRSHITVDGREILAGIDWERRKREIWLRNHGKCEAFLVGLPHCSNEMDDPHHIRPRSKGRDDSLDNLVGLCRGCHRLVDRRQPRWTRKGAAA
jgi:5-methylcytosine-specific restriction endonuclease McrA